MQSDLEPSPFEAALPRLQESWVKDQARAEAQQQQAVFWHTLIRYFLVINPQRMLNPQASPFLKDGDGSPYVQAEREADLDLVAEHLTTSPLWSSSAPDGRFSEGDQGIAQLMTSADAPLALKARLLQAIVSHDTISDEEFKVLMRQMRSRLERRAHENRLAGHSLTEGFDQQDSAMLDYLRTAVPTDDRFPDGWKGNLGKIAAEYGGPIVMFVIAYLFMPAMGARPFFHAVSSIVSGALGSVLTAAAAGVALVMVGKIGFKAYQLAKSKYTGKPVSKDKPQSRLRRALPFIVVGVASLVIGLALHSALGSIPLLSSLAGAVAPFSGALLLAAIVFPFWRMFAKKYQSASEDSVGHIRSFLSHSVQSFLALDTPTLSKPEVHQRPMQPMQRRASGPLDPGLRPDPATPGASAAGHPLPRSLGKGGEYDTDSASTEPRPPTPGPGRVHPQSGGRILPRRVLLKRTLSVDSGAGTGLSERQDHSKACPRPRPQVSLQSPSAQSEDAQPSSAGDMPQDRLADTQELSTLDVSSDRFRPRIQPRGEHAPSSASLDARGHEQHASSLEEESDARPT